MNSILETIAQDPEMIMVLTVGPMVLGAIVLIVWISCRTALRAAREKEQSRREIAAYVAEGSMSAEDGEKLLQPRPWYATSCFSSWWGGGGESPGGRSRTEA